MPITKYVLAGYKELKTKKGSVMYVLHFDFEEDGWEGRPGKEVCCMYDRLEGDLVIGGLYRVYTQSGSNFAVAVIEI